MDNFKDLLGIILFIAIGWHVKVYFSTETKLAGIFQKKPELGYVWLDSEQSDTKLFWEDTDVKWLPGMQHPGYNLYSSSVKDKWLPLPGYIVINGENGKISTAWEPGQLHPDFKAWAANEEGKWIPVTGYKFISKNNVWTDVVWGPNQYYDNLKIISLEEEGYFKTYPGYKFINPDVNLEVAWTPGLQNYNDNSLMAGTEEGTWVSAYQPTTLDYAKRWYIKGVAGKALKELFGDNFVSDELLRQSTNDGLQGIRKALQ